MPHEKVTTSSQGAPDAPALSAPISCGTPSSGIEQPAGSDQADAELAPQAKAEPTPQAGVQSWPIHQVRSVLRRMVDGETFSSIAEDYLQDTERNIKRDYPALLKHAYELGLLRLDIDADLEKTIRKRVGLQAVCVVDADTTTLVGQLVFARESASFFLETLREVYCRSASRNVFCALGGGEASALMLSALDAAAQQATGLAAIRSHLHLRTVTVGHQREHLSPFLHLVRCGLALGLDPLNPAPSKHDPNAALAWMPPPRSSTVAEYRTQHKDYLQHVQQRVNLIFTGCGGLGDYCVEEISQATSDHVLPQGWQGEILFNFFNENGKWLEHEAGVITALPGDILPNAINGKLRDRPREELRVVGCVFHTSADKVMPKALALRAAIGGSEGKWFTHLVCTKAIAEELDDLLGKSNANNAVEA